MCSCWHLMTAREQTVSFSKNVAPDRSMTLQWMAPHSWVRGNNDQNQCTIKKKKTQIWEGKFRGISWRGRWRSNMFKILFYKCVILLKWTIKYDQSSNHLDIAPQDAGIINILQLSCRCRLERAHEQMANSSTCNFLAWSRSLSLWAPNRAVSIMSSRQAMDKGHGANTGIC